MNAPIEQVINGLDGKPAFVVIPYHEYIKGFEYENVSIPNEVVGMVVMQGFNAIKAWRTHLGLKQTEVASKMGIKQSTYAQMEAAKKPTKKALERAAEVLGVKYAEIDFL